MNIKDSQPQNTEGKRGSDYFPGQVGPEETIEVAHATVSPRKERKDVLLMAGESTETTPEERTSQKEKSEQSIEELEKELSKKESDLIAGQNLENILQKQEQAHQKQRNAMVRRAIGKREGEESEEGKKTKTASPDTTKKSLPAAEKKAKESKVVRWAVTPRNTDERRRPLSSKTFPEVSATSKKPEVSTLTYDDAMTSVTTGGMDIPVDILTSTTEKKDEWAQIAELEKEALQEKMSVEKEGENTQEREKTTAEKLDDARLLYATKQKDHLQKIREDQGKIDKIRNFFGFGKKIKEDQLPQEIRDLKKEYDEMRVALGKEELAKFEQTLDPSLQEEERGGKIDFFKRGELFEKLIVEEQEKLKALSAENLPVKERGVLMKGLDWYLKQNKYAKLAISATVFGLASASGLGAGAAATAIGIRGARGLAGMFVGTAVGELAEKRTQALFKKDIERSKRWESGDMAYEDDLLSGIQGAEKAYLARLQLEQNMKRAGVYTKGVVGLLAGMSTSAAISQYQGHIDTTHLGTKIHHTPEPSKIHTEIKNLPTQEQPSITKSEIPHTDTHIAQKVDTPSAPPLPSEEYIKAAHGDGGIKMFEHLKSKLASEYPDPTKAPAEVQDILKGDPTKLAIKYKFFDPTTGHANESAVVMKGDELGFNKDGSLIFKHNGTESLLDKDHAYSGKMFDSDHSGTPHVETGTSVRTDTYSSPDVTDIPVNNANVLSPEMNHSPTIDEIPVNGSEVVAPLTGTRGAFEPVINEDMSINQQIPYAQHNPLLSQENIQTEIKGNMLYHSDAPEWGGNNHTVQSIPVEHTPTTSIDQISTQQIDNMANHQVIKDLDRYFGKTTMFGTHINGVQTETWNDLATRDAHTVLKEIHGETFKGDYMFGQYVELLENETHLQPLENENLEQFILRATKYNILHPQEAPSFEDLNTKPIRTFTRQGRNVTIKDNDGVYN